MTRQRRARSKPTKATVQRQPATRAEQPNAAPEAMPATIDDTLEKLDRSWSAFRSLVASFPLERIGDAIDGGRTYKQMFAHVSAWHDLTSSRLLEFSKSGAAQPLADEVDVVNARVARAATGRTTGEVVEALDASFARLRRQVSQLTDAQLAEHDGWAAAVIAENTYVHYDEHAPALQPEAGGPGANERP